MIFGKVIDNFSCYIVTILNSEKAKEAKVGDKLKVSFSEEKENSAEIKYIKPEDTGNNIIVLETKELTEELINYRKLSFNLIWWSYAGLKVPNQAIVEQNGLMEWIDGNIGSKLNMKYPSCILNGEYAEGKCISVAVATQNQIQDTGAKMIHLAPHTKSEIISKSIAANGGEADYRGTVKIVAKAHHCNAHVKCDTILIDELSKSDTIPKNIVENTTSNLNHEATVSKISKDKLFYLMSRGLNEDKARELIIMGFIDKFREELPREYAVELNQLLKNYFK